MNKKFDVVCAQCASIQPNSYSPFCSSCGGLTEAHFDLSRVKIKDVENPFERYFDLIPVIDREMLPKNSSFTPLVHARSLGDYLGLDKLYLKNETTHPTGTTKYRMAAISLPYLYESGVRHFCTSSTGNSSTAYAVMIKNIPGLSMSLFTGDEFRDRVNYVDHHGQITHYILHGASFAEAFNVAAQFAAKNGYTSERGFFNLGRREGLKIAWLEAVEQAGSDFDWYVQGVSSAMGVYGVYKAAKELLELGISKKLPRLLCTQQESCMPMVKAWRESAEQVKPEHIEHNPQGIAKAILRGDPSRVYPYMRKIVSESNGLFESATEDQIREARDLVKKLEDIDICFSAATAVASVIKLARNNAIPKGDSILINLTGSDRESNLVPENVVHMIKQNETWIER